jgi:hypothetical protein
MNALMAAAFVYADHRMLGMGVLARDRYVDSLRELCALAIDVQGEELQTLAWNEHGCVVALRMCGTIPDGGGPFERLVVSLFRIDGEQLLRAEDFEIDDALRAVARFEELCAQRSAGAEDPV